MYYCFKKFDGYFTHLYRVKVKNLNAGEHYRLIGQKVNTLHINLSSYCINECKLDVTTDLDIITEEEFNNGLNQTLNNLGINFNFKFI